MHSIKRSEYRIRIKFDKEPLVVEQTNYLTRIVNIYIVYDLSDWRRNPTNNLKFMNCLFGATNTVKNSNKEKFVCIGCRIKFDSAVS